MRAQNNRRDYNCLKPLKGPSSLCSNAKGVRRKWGSRLTIGVTGDHNFAHKQF